MNVEVTVGDVLNLAGDALISTANPWLNMSGGVNGAIRECEPDIQSELYGYLESIGKTAIPAGSVVRTSAGSLPFSHIIHAVAIDPFYETTHQIVIDTLSAALDLAVSLNAKSVVMPTLATGYGPMSINAFAHAFDDVANSNFPIDKLTIVVRSKESAAEVNSVLATGR